MHLNNCAGVMDRVRVSAFERMLWRVSKGNVFVRFADIEEKMEDPATGEELVKSVFVIFYQVRTIPLWILSLNTILRERLWPRLSRKCATVSTLPCIRVPAVPRRGGR